MNIDAGLIVWTVLVIAAAAAALAIWLYTVWDLSRRRDLSAVQRWVWFFVTIVAPVLGVAAYWLLRPRQPDMRPRV